MPFRRFLANVINNAVQQNAWQDQHSQQTFVSQNLAPLQTNGMYQSLPFTGQATHQPTVPNPQTVTCWEPLFTSTQPNPIFRRLIDAIFNHFTAEHPCNPHGLDPIKYVAAFTALMYTDSENKPRDFFIFATNNKFPSPEKFVYEALPIYYRNFHIQYVMNEQLPVLNREGFHTIMLRDTLGDPDTQFRRLNAFLGVHGARLVDPLTGQQFPSLAIPRWVFPANSDTGIWDMQRQMNVAFNRELGNYLNEMKRIGQWTHDVTMAGMSTGVWVRRDAAYNII